MWPTGYVSRRRDADGRGEPPAALAMTTLRPVIAQLAALNRGAGIAYIVVQVLIWHSFYTAAAWRLAAPVLTVTWAVIVAVRLRRRWPSPALVGADCAVYLALALGAAGCVPPSVRDDPFSWVVIGVCGQLIATAWFASETLSLMLTLAAPLAYWTGAMLWPVTNIRTLLGATILLIFVGLVHTLGRRALYHRATAADAALDQARRTASEQYVIVTAAIERREHERLLHDTVLNTLTALAREGPGDATAAVSRCRGDVAAIETALGGPDDLPAAAGDPLRELRAVVAEMRRRGLTVHVETLPVETLPVETLPLPVETGARTPAAVPARVAVAIANAAREALANVAAHAGTGEAWVTVRLIPDRLEVTVRDRGSGFDPARVGPGHLGLRRSVTERIADCGGRASIASVPGQGTRVRLDWPAAAVPAGARSSGMSPSGAGSPG